MDSSFFEEHSADSVYNFIDNASINHPSVDHASDSSLSSYFNSSDTSSRILIHRRSETHTLQRSGSSNSQLRSFRSEPAYKPLEGGDRGSERVTSPLRRHSHIFSDYPSETRRRIDKSLSVLRDLQNAAYPLNFSYQSKDEGFIRSSIHRERQETIEQKMVQDLDERYRNIIESLNTRITLLEEEVHKANQDLSTSRDYIRALETRDQATQTAFDLGVPIATQTVFDLGVEAATQTFFKSGIDAATSTDIQPADVDTSFNASEDSNVLLLENLMDNLHVETKEDLMPAMKELQRKAQLFEQMKEFIDHIEDLTWDTPHIPLTTTCLRPESTHVQLCNTHRAEWHRMQRRKQVRRKDAYSAERLDATLNQITEWAHTMRHVIS